MLLKATDLCMERCTPPCRPASRRQGCGTHMCITTRWRPAPGCCLQRPQLPCTTLRLCVPSPRTPLPSLHSSAHCLPGDARTQAGRWCPASWRGAHSLNCLSVGGGAGGADGVPLLPSCRACLLGTCSLEAEGGPCGSTCGAHTRHVAPVAASEVMLEGALVCQLVWVSHCCRCTSPRSAAPD